MATLKLTDTHSTERGLPVDWSIGSSSAEAVCPLNAVELDQKQLILNRTAHRGNPTSFKASLVRLDQGF